MKRNLIYLMAGMLAGGALLGSCVSEDPFGQGEGQLRMKMVLNHTLTRSGDNVTDQSLADNATIYISGSQGLLYKFKGTSELPSSLSLKTGRYVAEAWAGDSVSASFDKKFYRGYQPFDIQTAQTTDVVLNCKIANVVSSIAPAQEFLDAVKTYKVTVGHSYATLDFTDENKDSHAYFMMPYNKETAAFESALAYTITGEMTDGTPFEKTGTIEDVQRAHEYVINLAYTPYQADPYGGSVITVTIDDHELVVDEKVEVSGAPIITGVGFNLAEPMLCEPGAFVRHSLFVQSLGEYRTLAVHTDDFTAFGLPGADVDFATATAEALENWRTAGLSCEFATDAEGVHTARVFMEAEMLNRLPQGLYSLRLTAVDANGKRRERTLAFNVSLAGVVIQESEWQEIYATRATLHVDVVRDDAVNPGVRYREVGTPDWTTAYPAAASGIRTRAAGDKVAVTVTGLKPGTRYEYQAISDGFINESSKYFTTEAAFLFPNSSFEQWGTNSEGVYIPSADGTVSFWDTGNHGSMIAQINITTPAEDLIHTGAKSAKLASKKASVAGIGKLAAGNLFVGKYEKTAGADGELTFGRPFNGSRPVKLRGWVYYKPGTVDNSREDEMHPDVVKGSTDQGIIYVALTTRTFDIKTKKSERQLFDPNSTDVLAYGELVFTSEYGSSTEMREFEITLEYRDAAALQRAGYVVLCCSASRYGDYYTGSTSSVMYVDDLEFVY